jgi:predicted metalloprotease with PDZ domain
MNPRRHREEAVDMNRRVRISRRASLQALALFMAARALAVDPPEIGYRLSMPEPWTHLFHVEVSFPRPPGGAEVLEVAMPAWRTGRYALYDFAGGVQDFRARGPEGEPLRWEKTDKSTWRIEHATSFPVRVTYSVYANEFEQRTRGLDDEHGFVDGTGVFIYAPRLRAVPVRLTVLPYGDWHVTTGLDSVRGSSTEFTAPGYDHLVDCPLEIGTQRDFGFLAEGKPHVLSLSGACSCDADSIITDIRRIVSMNRKFWGDLPYRRYVFLFRAGSRGNGATEHLNSSVYSIGPSYGHRPSACRNLAGLLSHEFFHTWNVKQLRPKGMDPYDWTKENYYRELWIAEGSTSYMHGLLMMRAGYGTVAGYLEGIAAAIRSDRQRPGNRAQSLTECSFDSWITFNRPGPQAYNSQTDFYGKGATVSMLLDLELRHSSGNAASFDDLLRTLYRRFPLGSGGYTVRDVQRIADELAGKSMQDFFDRYVYGTDPLPWERVLGYAGLVVRIPDSSGGGWTGLEISSDGPRPVIWRVVAGSPASAAGLSVNDEVVALDGVRVQGEALPARLADLAPGDSVRLAVFRNDRLREFGFRARTPPVPRYEIVRGDSLTKGQKTLLESWLGGRNGK